MSDVVLKIDNLGKRYRIGASQSKTLNSKRSSVRQTFASPFKYLASTLREPTPEETLWALRNVSFEVRRGEAIGIIGHNGAGKSTLLKILSGITKPTEGQVWIRGRIGSLLEVGTGFHPELTGRENIYLNGAILGMKRSEIERKFDEIVAFSEVERFLDTPVKRYSTGMYMRLAFAVAAHLDPDILVVDEVLAVGDLAFQKKCLGKMDEVARQGRTVLLVSHNLGSIMSLCSKTLLLSHGCMMAYGNTREVVDQYLRVDTSENNGVFVRKNFDPEKDLVERADVLNGQMSNQKSFEYGEQLNLLLKTNKNLKMKHNVELRIKNSKQELIGYAGNAVNPQSKDIYTPGETILIKIPNLRLVADTYYIDIICRIPPIYYLDNWLDTIHFAVVNSRPGNLPFSISNNDQFGSVVLDDVIFSVA